MEDGLRLLVARFCERGMRTDRDGGWPANLGPNETLLKAVPAEENAWRESLKRHREELLARATFDALIEPNQLNSVERKRRAGRCGRATRPDEPV